MQNETILVGNDDDDDDDDIPQLKLHRVKN